MIFYFAIYDITALKDSSGSISWGLSTHSTILFLSTHCSMVSFLFSAVSNALELGLLPPSAALIYRQIGNASSDALSASYPSIYGLVMRLFSVLMTA